MSEENKNQSAFIEELLQRAKKTQTNTMIVSLVLAAVVFGYMLFLTNWLKKDLTQEGVRSLIVTEAQAYIDSEQSNLRGQIVSFTEGQVDNYIPELKRKLEKEIPALIQDRLPNYITSKIPDVRQSFQTQADDYFARNLDDVRPQIAQGVDEYLGKYNADMKRYSEIIEAAKNTDGAERSRLELLAKNKIQELADAFIDNLLEVAKTREFGNADVNRGYKSSLARLRRVNADLITLSKTPEKDLKGEDRELRYAVALMLDKLEWSTPNHLRKPEEEKKDPAPKKK